MNIAEYWSQKAKLIDSTFEGWQKKEEIQVRKLVIAKVMDIPVEHITYYLKRDSWYHNFVMNDDSEIDRSFAAEESTKEKIQSIIDVYFYKADYEILCGIQGDSALENSINKHVVCDCIKELVEGAVYQSLSKEDKSLLDTLEQVYFEPIELFNEYVEEAVGSEKYHSMLLEQWKCANDMASNISSQRNNMNNFYMSLMSILIGGILLSNQVLDSNLLVRTVLYGAILIIGTVCCSKWIAQIDNYGRLNGAKYEVINAIERSLPANVLLYEYMHTEQNARRNKIKINFSKQEKDIAKLFRVIVILVPAILLIFGWVEFVCGKDIGEVIWEMFRK